MELKEQFEKHEEKDDSRFEKISDALTDIKGNHLSHMEVDIRWLKWIEMGVIAGIVSILVKLFLKV